MLKIGIDARLYRQTGVGVYLRNLLYFLQKIVNDESVIYVYLLPDDFNKVIFSNNNFVKKLTYSSWHTFSEQINFAAEIYRDKLDLMHFTYFSYPVAYKKKFIATIHDTTPLLFKTGKASTKAFLLYEMKFRAFKFVISQQMNNAKFVITPTKSVMKQLVGLYGEKYKDKIKPIYEGVNYELTRMSHSREGGNPGKKTGSPIRLASLKLRRSGSGMTVGKNYFIYIGNFYPHKNAENLVKAFSRVKTNVKLILIGPNDFFSSRLFRLIDQLKQNERIKFFHNPRKTELIYFYKNALALIHPSISEGFGLPIIEAAYFNLPVIASDIEVFRELLNDRYIKFDPRDPEDIAVKIESFLKNKNKFDYKEIMKKYSFEEMTKQTLDLYRQALL